MNHQLNNITPKELKLLFRLDGNDPCREHLIGYVRGDFGKSGNEFYTTWFPEDDSKKTEQFRETHQCIPRGSPHAGFTELPGHGGLLQGESAETDTLPL